MTTPSDAELCDRHRDGDRSAGAELVRRHRGVVKSIALRLIPPDSRYDLDDLIQAGLAAMLKAADSYHAGGGTRFSTYAYSPVRWAVIDELNATDGTPVESDHDVADDPDDRGLDSLPAPARTEPPDPGAYAPLFAGLSPLQERVVRMAYGIDHEPLSQRGIAARLGIAPSTVRKRLAEALALIRAALDGTGFDPSEVAARPPDTGGG